MKIAIGNDHRGVEVKKELINYLKLKGYEVEDFGTDSNESVDYPIYAFKVAESISNKKNNLGILLCGTGIGMSIAANKVKGIRCAKVDNKNDCYYTRLHNDANIIALSAEMEIKKIKEIIDIFLTTKFSNEDRHIRRIEMINNYDN